MADVRKISDIVNAVTIEAQKKMVEIGADYAELSCAISIVNAAIFSNVAIDTSDKKFIEQCLAARSLFDKYFKSVRLVGSVDEALNYADSVSDMGSRELAEKLSEESDGKMIRVGKSIEDLFKGDKYE